MVEYGRRLVLVLAWLLVVVLCVSLLIRHVDPCQAVSWAMHHDASDEHYGEYGGAHTQSQHLSYTQVAIFTDETS